MRREEITKLSEDGCTSSHIEDSEPISFDCLGCLLRAIRDFGLCEHTMGMKRYEEALTEVRTALGLSEHADHEEEVIARIRELVLIEDKYKLFSHNESKDKSGSEPVQNVNKSETIDVVNRIKGLLSLEQNWDSYGGLEIDKNVAFMVLNFISDAMESGAPKPEIVPMPCGGIQVEWHIEGIDLEVEFIPGEKPCFLLVDTKTGKELEGILEEENFTNVGLLSSFFGIRRE